MDKSVQLIRFKITPSNDVLLADSHQIIKKSPKRTFFKDIKSYYLPLLPKRP